MYTPPRAATALVALPLAAWVLVCSAGGAGAAGAKSPDAPTLARPEEPADFAERAPALLRAALATLVPLQAEGAPPGHGVLAALAALLEPSGAELLRVGLPEVGEGAEILVARLQGEGPGAWGLVCPLGGAEPGEGGHLLRSDEWGRLLTQGVSPAAHLAASTVVVWRALARRGRLPQRSQVLLAWSGPAAAGPALLQAGMARAGVPLDGLLGPGGGAGPVDRGAALETTWWAPASAPPGVASLGDAVAAAAAEVLGAGSRVAFTQLSGPPDWFDPAVAPGVVLQSFRVSQDKAGARQREADLLAGLRWQYAWTLVPRGAAASVEPAQAGPVR